MPIAIRAAPTCIGCLHALQAGHGAGVDLCMGGGGGFVLAQMKKNGIGVQLMTYESVRFMDTLNNDRDRVLFGLAAKPALSPAGEAGGAVLDGSK